jgi:hypothetical protein
MYQMYPYSMRGGERQEGSGFLLDRPRPTAAMYRGMRELFVCRGRLRVGEAIHSLVLR